jgi:hypothetical protein
MFYITRLIAPQLQSQVLGNPFRVGKKMHPLTLEALIGTCSKMKSFVVDFATSTGMYYYKHSIDALDFHYIISSNILFFSSNSVLACRT